MPIIFGMGKTLRGAMRRIALTVCCFIVIAPQAQSPESPERDPIDTQIAAMSLSHKVGQLFMVSFYGSGLNQEAREMFTRWRPGAAVLLPSNLGAPEAITRLTNQMQTTVLEAGGVPLFIAVDQEGGTIARLQEGFTQWPVPMLWAATDDEALLRRVGAAMGRELRAVGINMNLAPVLDVLTRRDNPVMARRTFGSDVELVARMTSALIAGLQSENVLATAKHFPGHGDTSEDSHHTLPLVHHDLQRLNALELLPYQRAFAPWVDVGAVMVAHVAYPALDPDPTRPASLSPLIVEGLLRETLGYEGLIVTDALDMDAIDLVYSPEAASLAALQAGHDLVLVGAHVSPAAQMRAMQAVVEAVENGTISEARLDASVRRILSAKARYGLLTDWQPLDPERARERLNVEAHSALVDELFAQGITLVHDERDLLPLAGDVAVIYPATRPSLWRECAAKASPDDKLLPLGVFETPTAQQIAAARQVASQAERVLVFTLNAGLDPSRSALVRALPPEKTVAVALWSPYDLLFYPDVAAYVVTYSPLLRAAPQICAGLFGETPIRGRLSVDLRP